jgi:tetratricopeptide (TPR) repeat protein
MNAAKHGHKMKRIPVWNRRFQWPQWLLRPIRALTFKRVLLWAVAIVALWVACRDVFKEAVLLGPFSVPKSLQEDGYSPEALANQVADQIADISRHARTNAARREFHTSSEVATPDVEVPETGMSWHAVVQFLQSALNRQPTYISGDVAVVKPQNVPASTGNLPWEVDLTVREVYRQNRRSSQSLRVKVAGPHDIVRKLSKMVLGQISPYVLAVYTLDFDHDYDTASTVLRPCLNTRDCPERKWAFNGLGALLIAQNRLDDAAEAFRHAMSLDPASSYAYVGMGNALKAMNKLDDAMAYYRRAGEIDRHDASAHNNMGVILGAQALVAQAAKEDAKAQARLAQAGKEYAKATTLDKDYAVAFNNWGVLLLHQKRCNGAISKFQMAVEADPDYVFALNNWGQCLAQLGRVDESMGKYRRAIEINPSYASPYYNLAEVMEGRVDLEGAASYYRQSAELSNDPNDYAKLADVLRRLGRAGDAEGASHKADDLKRRVASQ